MTSSLIPFCKLFRWFDEFLVTSAANGIDVSNESSFSNQLEYYNAVKSFIISHPILQTVRATINIWTHKHKAHSNRMCDSLMTSSLRHDSLVSRYLWTYSLMHCQEWSQFEILVPILCGMELKYFQFQSKP